MRFVPLVIALSLVLGVALPASAETHPWCSRECSRLFAKAEPKKPRCSTTRRKQVIRGGNIVTVTLPVPQCEERIQDYEQAHTAWQKDNDIRLPLTNFKQCISWCDHIVSLRDRPVPPAIRHIKHLLTGAVLPNTAKDDKALTKIPLYTQGTLVVSSQPTGAEIVLNGEVVGITGTAGPLGTRPASWRPEPSSTNMLLSGTYDVIVRAPKTGHWPYRQWNKTVLLAVGQTLKLEPKLTPIHGTVSVTVPGSGNILIDGTEVAKGSKSLQSGTVLTGKHTLTVRAQGYADWSHPINVVEGQVSAIEFPKDAKGARLTVTSDPTAATVHLGSVTLGVTPLIIVGLATRASQARLKVSYPGYETWSTEVTLGTNTSEEVSADLNKLPTSGDHHWTNQHWRKFNVEPPFSAFTGIPPAFHYTSFKTPDGDVHRIQYGAFISSGFSLPISPTLRLHAEIGGTSSIEINPDFTPGKDDGVGMAFGYGVGAGVAKRFSKLGYWGRSALRINSHFSHVFSLGKENADYEAVYLENRLAWFHWPLTWLAIAPEVRWVLGWKHPVLGETSALFAGAAAQFDFGDFKIRLWYNHGVAKLWGNTEPLHMAGLDCTIYDLR